MLPRSTTYKSSCHKGSEALCGVCVASLMEGLNDGGTDDDCMMQMLVPGSMSRKSSRKHGKSVYEITQQPTSDKLTFGFFVFKKTAFHSSEKMPVGKKQKNRNCNIQVLWNCELSRFINPRKRVQNDSGKSHEHGFWRSRTCSEPCFQKSFWLFLTRIDVYVS